MVPSVGLDPQLRFIARAWQRLPIDHGLDVPRLLIELEVNGRERGLRDVDCQWQSRAGG
jgi:hypothetical protein